MKSNSIDNRIRLLYTNCIRSLNCRQNWIHYIQPGSGATKLLVLNPPLAPQHIFTTCNNIEKIGVIPTLVVVRYPFRSRMYDFSTVLESSPKSQPIKQSEVDWGWNLSSKSLTHLYFCRHLSSGHTQILLSRISEMQGLPNKSSRRLWNRAVLSSWVALDLLALRPFVF